MCLRGLIIPVVLFCKIHYLVVHCASLVQWRCPGGPEGEKSKIHPSLTPSPLLATKNIILDKRNAFEGSKRMYEVVYFLSFIKLHPPALRKVEKVKSFWQKREERANYRGLIEKAHFGPTYKLSEKERDLTQSYDKSPNTHRKIQKSNVTKQKC